jgi:hypothetical protein
MTRHLFAVAVVIGIRSFTCSNAGSADDVAKVHGGPPRIFIASKIDAGGKLFLSVMDSRQKKVSRQVEKNGKKTTEERTVTYPVAVLNRQTVSLKGVTI